MADDNIFDPKKIIDALRAKGISDAEISKLYGKDFVQSTKEQPQPNSAKVRKFQQEQAWKYNNKHKRDKRMEDLDPDYEPIEELRTKPAPKKKKAPAKPKKTDETDTDNPKIQIGRKKATKPKKKPKNIWDKAAEERLKKLYVSGYSLSEIAKEFGTTADAISGKITRLRNVGWKGMVGTTHNPLPTEPEKKSTKRSSELSPEVKHALSSILRENFGVIGNYFSKRWGLDTDGKSKGSASSPKGDISAVITKSHQDIVSSIIKLDLTMRRGTSSLTKAITLSTAKISDGLTQTEELIKRSSVTDTIEKPGDGSTTTKSGGGMGGIGGAMGALFIGSALTSLLSDRSEASVNPNDRIDDPQNTENKLRNEGENNQNDSETPKEIKIKVKELTYDADKIEFETDDLRFKSKVTGENVFNNQKSQAPNGAGGPSETGPSAAPASPTGSSGGFFGNLLDKLRGGPGGPGMFNTLADKIFGTGKHNNTQPNGDVSPSSKSNPTPSTSGGSTSDSAAGGASGTLAKQREPMAEQINNDPELKENIKAMASAEEGTGASNSNARKALMETILNRAISHSSNVKNIVGNKDYYQPYQNGSYNNHLSKVRSDDEYSKQLDKELNEVIKGSNYSNYATHNGSGSVKDNAIQTQSTGWIAPNGEAFTRKDRPEFSNIHGTGTTDMEGDWFRRTKAATEAAQKSAKKSDDVFTKGTSPILQTPTIGSDLNDAQKQKDDTDIQNDSQSSSPAPGVQSNADDSGKSKSTVQTALLETQGPNHFADFPMSDQGVGA